MENVFTRHMIFVIAKFYISMGLVEYLDDRKRSDVFRRIVTVAFDTLF